MLEEDERTKKLLPRAHVEQALAELTSIYQNVGQQLVAEYGEEALDMINDAISLAEQRSDELFKR